MTTQTEPGLDASTLAAALATIANARMRAEFDAGGPLGVSKPLSPSIRADHMLALCDVAAAAARLVTQRLEQPDGVDPWPWWLQMDWASQPPGKCCIGCGGPYYESVGHSISCPAIRLDAALAALAGTGAA